MSGNGSRMLMNAPNVPNRNGGGIGMKYGRRLDVVPAGDEVVRELVQPQDAHHG